MAMTPAQAADTYWELVDQVTEHQDVVRRFEAACDVLKRHAREQGWSNKLFRGIRFLAGTPKRVLDKDQLYAAFGQEKVDACRVDGAVPISLRPEKRPTATAARRPAA